MQMSTIYFMKKTERIFLKTYRNLQLIELSGKTRLREKKAIHLFIFKKNFFLNFILFIFLYSRFLLVINFIHISVYMSIPVAQFITPPPPPLHHFPPLVSIRLFSTSVSQFLPANWIICTIFLGSTYMR